MKDFIKTRPMFSACSVAFILGIICSKLDSLSIISVCAVVFCCLLFLLSAKFELKRECIVIVIVSLIVSLSSFIYTRYVYEPVCDYVDRKATVEGVIVSSSENSYVIKCKSISDGESVNNANFKIYLNLTKPNDNNKNELLPSAKVLSEVTFLDSSYLDRFDSDGVHIVAVSDEIRVISSANTYSIRFIYSRFKTWVRELLPISDSEVSGFIKSMMFGDKSEISGKFHNAFSKIGLAHVMAVSGMHLTFAVVLFDFILVLFGLSYKPRAYASIFAVILFTFITGFPVSCVRCAIMLIIVYIGRIRNEMDDSLTSLSVSAILIIVFTPYNIFSFSYLLSLSASFGIIVIAPYLNSLVKLEFRNKSLTVAVKFIIGIINISLAANIACLPVFIFVFKEVSLIAPLTNLILLIPIQLLFYIGFLSSMFSFFPFIESVVTTVAKWIYNIIEDVTYLCYNFKYTSVNAGYKYFYLVFFLFATVMFGTYIISVYFKKKKLWPYFTSYMVFVAVMFVVNYSIYHDAVQVDFVDVGQGSLVMATKEESAVIFDCGGTKTDELYDSLQFNTVKNIELILLTHLDSDHLNMLEYLIRYYNIEKIIYPEFCKMDNDSVLLFNSAKASGIDVCSISKDTQFDVFGGASVSAYVEKAYDSAIDANTSAVYMFEYQGNKLLVTGDMDINQEYVYLKYGDKLDCDILSVAHHGSKKSSLKAALIQYSPIYSVISVAKNNSYGFPDPVALARLKECSTVLRTDELSTISFIFDKKGYRLKQ